MTLQDQITQQESSVKLLEQLVRARRASQADLDEAQARLAAMRGTEFRKTVHVPVKMPEKPTSDLVREPRENPVRSAARSFETEVLNRISDDDVKAYTARISSQIDQAQRQMAELSNQLHTVPPHVDCPELTRPIVNLKRQIEALWTRKRHAERNGVPAPEQAGEVAEKADRAADRPDDELKLLQREQDRQKLREKRSKLRKKLDDPRRSTANDARWRVDLAKVQHELNELDAEISIRRG